MTAYWLITVCKWIALAFFIIGAIYWLESVPEDGER